MWNDRNSMERVIGDIYIKNNDNFLYIDPGVNRSIINMINKNLGAIIKKRLPQIFIEAYQKTKMEIKK